MIEIKSLNVSFEGKNILENFSLELPEKGSVCIFAPSGRGKTTLLRLICGLQKADSGSICGLDGKRISVLFQENRLIPHLSALDNLKLILPPERHNEAEFWLKEVGLENHLHKTPLQLSGGMNRRVSIARALAFGGDIFLFDEPFQGLDEQNIDKMISIIKKACQNSLLILVTHSRYEAEMLCDKIIYL